MATPTIAADNFPHEHEFTADVTSSINLIIEKDPSLPFSAAKFDRRTKGVLARRDLTLIGKDGQTLVTGEIKLPYQRMAQRHTMWLLFPMPEQRLGVPVPPTSSPGT